MIDFGFTESIVKINNFVNKDSIKILTTATCSEEDANTINNIFKLKNEIIARIENNVKSKENHIEYCVNKNKRLLELINLNPNKSVLVFVNRKDNCDSILYFLAENLITSHVFSSDHGQIEREQILNSFKNKEFPVLICTDLASRGLNVFTDLIINYDMPRDVVI